MSDMGRKNMSCLLLQLDYGRLFRVTYCSESVKISILLTFNHFLYTMLIFFFNWVYFSVLLKYFHIFSGVTDCVLLCVS